MTGGSDGGVWGVQSDKRTLREKDEGAKGGNRGGVIGDRRREGEGQAEGGAREERGKGLE